MTREERSSEKQEEIFDEERKEKRKSLIGKIFKIVLLITTLSCLIFCYTTYISTVSIVVNEKRITSEKIDASFNGLKLIQFSDLHYGSTFLYDEAKKLVNLINERKPDIVVFTGDLIKKDYNLKNKDQEKLIKLLQSIDTTLGKYAVLGEEDKESVTTILNQSGFTILNNDYDLIYKDNNKPILITGLASLLKKETDVDKAFSYFKQEGANTNIYNITLMHEGDNYLNIKDYQTDLVLAGHSHNGEIRIPYIGSIVKFSGSKTYYDKYYKDNDTDIYVSSGLGTSKFDIRLFCRPSINFFRFSNN